MCAAVSAALLLLGSAGVASAGVVHARLGDSLTELFGPLRGATVVSKVLCHFGTRPPARATSWAVSPLLDALNATCDVPRLRPEEFWANTPPRASLSLSLKREGGAERSRLDGRGGILQVEFLFPFNATLQARAVVPNLVHAVHIGGSKLPTVACLSLLTAAVLWNPTALVLHVDKVPPSSASLECVRKFATLEVHRARAAPAPGGRTSASASRPRGSFVPLRPEHMSDILRLEILIKRGGVYLDADAFAVQPLGKLRRYEFSMGFERSGQSKLNNGLMLSAPDAPFAKLLRASYNSWSGGGWDEQSCVVPFKLATQQPSSVHVENYPEPRWPTGRKRPGPFGVSSYNTVILRGHMREAYGPVIAAHLPAFTHSPAFNKRRLARGDAHFILLNALSRMAVAPSRLHALAGHPSPGGELCDAVLFLTKELLRTGHLAPVREDLPAQLSPLFPADLPDCANATALLGL
mmetsp:Transcript_26902/g.68139  ORF Transcript_26902/g.68139 Transcript_26902/m.68139 type:complete len:466 (+) Transcript_26902:134-1531(+)